MTAYNIALLPGDGIGPETMDATRIVLERVTNLFPEIQLHCQSYRAGAELFRETGETLPASVLSACREADAVLLAAIGLPDVRFPDGTEVQPTMMVGLRRALALHSAVRPVKLYEGVSCPLKDIGAGIENAVASLLADGRVRTPDLGGSASTTDVANAVASSITAKVATPT